MTYDEDIYDELKENFDLLCNIIKQKSEEHQFKADLSKIEEIINKKIPETLKKNAPEDFYDLYVDFKSEYEKFRDFISYDKLIGKNIIALGGGFSSGKSSFLNTLMGVSVLPSDIDPSTSVPTYIVKGETHEVMGVNVFDAKIYMEPKYIKKIAHGFGEMEDEDDKIVSKSVTLGHVLDNIFFSTPLHKYENIAFLDTPGYSKPDSEKYSAKTDEQIARGQLNSSNFIIWFVKADSGTITEEDIKFIKSLRGDIPMLIVVNKADDKPVSELKLIIEKVKKTLDLKGIEYVDVCAFTSKIELVNDDAKDFIEMQTSLIKNYISEWNNQIYESNFARNFKRIFVRCNDFYEMEIDEESNNLVRLNTSLTMLAGEDIDDEIIEPLNALVREAKKNVDELKNIKYQLKELQNEFFSEIKFISDIVGIQMPQPSEIDLLEEKVQNPIVIMDKYKKEHGIKTDRSMVEMLDTIFEGVEPKFNNLSENKMKSDLYNTILECSTVLPEEIQINQEYINNEDYLNLLSKG